jgi:small subunit ribosomal protein S14
MKHLISKDRKRRNNFRLFELSYVVGKTVASMRHLSSVQRVHFFSLLRSAKASTFVRLRNRCVVTGRSRSVSREFRISRIKFREMASFGLLPGVRKSSW